MCHVVLFPFMAKGHTIPLLQLARLLVARGVRITVFTTPANHAFISDIHSLPDTDISIIDLPFPEYLPGIPPGIQSIDKLPSLSLFVPFVNGTKQMQASFEALLHNVHTLSPVSCIVSDGFFPWTVQPASRFGIPRIAFYPMCQYAMTVSHDVAMKGLFSQHEPGNEPLTVPSFPRIKITRDDFEDPFDKPDPRGPHWDFIMETAAALRNSYGMLMNTFYELEQPFVDYWARECGPKAWNVGPLGLAGELQPRELETETVQKPEWIQWLDQKRAEDQPVLYIAFGTLVRVKPGQLREIAAGLETAKVSFLWVLREGKEEVGDGFEGNVRDRGMIVNEWVDQREILMHPSVQGFLSHCGWNSVLEGICAGVPILALPMMAEQYLNAKMVEEEIGAGLRVRTVDGTPKGFVSGEGLKNAVMELMEGERGKELRKKVKEVAEDARKAVSEGGSSWHALNELISEIQKHKEINVLMEKNGTC